LDSLSLSKRLPLTMVGLSFVAICIIAVLSIQSAKTALTTEAHNKLQIAKEGRLSELTNYFQYIEEDLRLTASNVQTVKALLNFNAGFKRLRQNAETDLQAAYIHDNPNPIGQKHLLDRAEDGSRYSRFHAQYHPWLRDLQTTRGYYDIFLINAKGDVAYTVFKENDYATNLKTGAYADSGLAKVYAAVDKAEKGTIAFEDFAPYAPSANAPASFIATPLYRDTTYIGALIFQMPIGRINTIMNNEKGMGETGESYLVGRDFLMRSDSRFSEDSTILQKRVETDSVSLALSGQKGHMETYDYRNKTVLSSYAPFSFHDITWAVIAEIDSAEAFAAIDSQTSTIMIAALVITAITSLIGFGLSRTITRPIMDVTAVMRQLAKDNLRVDIHHTARKDELGQMARAVAFFKEQLQRIKTLETEQKQQEEIAQEQRRKALHDMAEEMEKSVGDIVIAITSAISQLEASAQQLSSTAQSTSTLAQNVLGTAEATSDNVRTVAAATEELSASDQEISRTIHQSTTVATTAAEEAETTQNAVTAMVDEIQKIDQFTTLIADIAEQTNLLALNATIESARAGEAGKGFAVVASEVKNLANQTSQTTTQITAQIETIQTVTDNARKAVNRIHTTITDMDQLTNSIAATVEQQSAATSDIARNIEEAASGTHTVTTNIQTVNTAATETQTASSQIAASCRSLAEQSTTLSKAVETFLITIRSA